MTQGVDPSAFDLMWPRPAPELGLLRRLACAVVLQAVGDLRGPHTSPQDRASAAAFFNSEGLTLWCRETDLDPEAVRSRVLRPSGRGTR